jgi:arylsulfatase A-like enzyme
VSLFTGEYPAIYRKGIIPGLLPLPNYFIPEEKLLLSEKLKEIDYDLRKSVENPVVEMFNCLRGFKNFNRTSIIEKVTGINKYRTRKIEKITGIKNKSKAYKNTYEVLNYLIYNTGNRPFFILDWILDPHAPYKAPEDFMNQVIVDQNKLTREPPYYSKITLVAKEAFGKWNDYERKYLKDLYIKEVESVDERVGYIIKALKHKNLLKNTYIIFTADHGEEFEDHDDWGHGQNYFDELIRVPLILTGPGIHKGKRESLLTVSLIDLMITLKDLLGLDYQESGQGMSFAKSLSIDSTGKQFSATLDNRDIYFAEPAKRNTYQEALLSGSYKLVVTRDNKYELYNLSQDPDELIDISKEKSALVNTLLDKIAAIKDDNTKRREKYFDTKESDTQSVRTVDNDTLNRIKALGYLQ